MEEQKEKFNQIAQNLTGINFSNLKCHFHNFVHSNNLRKTILK